MKKILVPFVFLLIIGQSQGQFGINPIVNNQIKAFPKVVDEYLYVQLPKLLLENNPRFEVRNSTGKIVATARLSGTVNAIFMGDMPNGTYQLNVDWAGGSAQIYVYKGFAW